MVSVGTILYFGSADILASITFKPYTKALVIRMRSVSAMDATAHNAFETLCKRCEEAGIVLILSHVNEQPMNSMIKSGLADIVGRDRFCSHIDEALELAVKLSEEADTVTEEL